MAFLAWAAAASPSQALLTTTIPLYVPNMTNLPTDVTAHLQTIDEHLATTYSVTCDASNGQCPFNSDFRLVQASGYAGWSSAGSSGSTTYSCTVTSTISSAVCTSYGPSGNRFLGSSEFSVPASYVPIAVVSSVAPTQTFISSMATGSASSRATNTAAGLPPSATVTGSGSSSSRAAAAAATAPIATRVARMGGVVAAVAFAVVAL